ncbi:phage tail protein [Enterobacter cloacae]|nr:phage tail protein [Enterobacter cloacae]EKX4006944.1 tail fiber protein [Enterobacter cloacae]
MNSSDTPSRITKAFGVNGLKNTIPVDSSTSTDNNGVATFDKGFPAVTMQPLSAGGIPPSGKDMNGVLYSTTIQQQWQNAGMTYPFSQDFSDAVSGYPKGAIVPSSVYTGQWLNLNEANGASPESPTGANTGWVPINNYGVTQITMTTGSVVMSSLQAAKDRIIISGALTANVNLIFPAWIKSWVVHNNCTGNFTITCRTASGTGVVVIPGLVSRLFCDGVNISDETYNPNNDMVGMLAAFAANSAPTGWLAADGSAVSRTTYARLFSRIGTIYGAGNGTTTFNLPDGRGVFLRGFDAGRGLDSGRVFGSYQEDSVKTIDLRFYGRQGSGTGSRTVLSTENNRNALYTTGISQDDGSVQPAFQQIGSTSENRVKNLSQLMCIKY